MSEKITKSDAEWRDQLEPNQFEIARNKGTEPAFRNEHWDNKKPGEFRCVCCGAPLFESDHKYDSGSGWPSFYQPAEGAVIEEKEDASLARVRTEVLCGKCDAHLGHVFPDGPEPTGLRYCINSASLDFKEKPEA